MFVSSEHVHGMVAVQEKWQMPVGDDDQQCMKPVFLYLPSQANYELCMLHVLLWSTEIQNVGFVVKPVSPPF